MGYVILFYDNGAFVNKKTQAREKVSDLLKSIEYNHSLPDISRSWCLSLSYVEIQLSLSL